MLKFESLERREMLTADPFEQIGPEPPDGWYPRPQEQPIVVQPICETAFVPHQTFDAIIPTGMDASDVDDLRELHKLALSMDGDNNRILRGLECVDNFGRDLTNENEKAPELGLGGFCGAWTEELAGAVQQLDIWSNPNFTIEVVTLYRGPGWIWGWKPFNCHNALKVTHVEHGTWYFDNGYLGGDLQIFQENQFTRPWFNSLVDVQVVPQLEFHT